MQTLLKKDVVRSTRGVTAPNRQTKLSHGASVISFSLPEDISRRAALKSGIAIVASNVLLVQRADAAEGTSTFKYRYQAVENLSSFQKSDMRAAFRSRAESAIKQFLDPSDAPACIHLALLDAGTYDITTKRGGMTGAIMLSNASAQPPWVKPVAEKLKKAKAAIDEGDEYGAGPISWADLLYLSGKVTSQSAWKAAKGKYGNQPGDPWGNPWDGITLGRIDTDIAGPNKVPGDDASPKQIQEYLLQLGAKPGSGGFLSAKPPFWEKPGFLIWTSGAQNPTAEEVRLAAAVPAFADAKADYDKSRRSIARTNYEVDFAVVYNKLTNLGASYNPDAYLFPLKVMDINL
ncbi:hypothetical protein CEUSTIGMA_g11132.t1 [Chlamydomonas eustigma]|uniref:Plant heme peroxidase family profile domain-containing protein n=1 Tax=Chlamydomonas eustigma TaxID=1157962 RepID=A0A250XKW5_9CHLO|nr:hypothetical protein CEUSTIGMA_g11132.t1 [Chlamydomonas eustigma]|eukprot:GAX83707.1 hypothetical protein CEUSTIGMA_g11132.t1 [Chlamydomonas eustigma]